MSDDKSTVEYWTEEARLCDEQAKADDARADAMRDAGDHDRCCYARHAAEDRRLEARRSRCLARNDGPWPMLRRAIAAGGRTADRAIDLSWRCAMQEREAEEVMRELLGGES